MSSFPVRLAIPAKSLTKSVADVHPDACSRETRVLAATSAGIAEAATALREGKLVAFPTETVYGLGASALDEKAVAGIYRAKGRAANDPLIVHLPEVAHLETVAVDVPDLARTLAARFWPGPLTLVLRKADAIPSNVSAGLDTVGVRLPAHPVAQALLREAGIPVAAPSANLFTRPSPTRPEHVLDDLRGRIDIVLDDGATPIGVESTILDLSHGEPVLLRPGGIPLEEIEAELGASVRIAAALSHEHAQAAPGMGAIHYAPRTPLVLVTGAPEQARVHLAREVHLACASGASVGVLLLDEDRGLFPPGLLCESVGSWNEPGTAAGRLFHALRELDRGGADVLYARQVADPTHGLGRALADRLRRAASRIMEAEET